MRQASGSIDSYRRGHWSVEEDIRLMQFVKRYGEGRWSKLAKAAGLQRCGKSCRLRWVNYLRPDIKRGHITEEEERLIIKLHTMYGNRWSYIAIHLPGRSDNEIKNYWRSHIKKKMKLNEDGAKCSSSTQSVSSNKIENGESFGLSYMLPTNFNISTYEKLPTMRVPSSSDSILLRDDSEGSFNLVDNNIEAFNTLMKHHMSLSPSYNHNTSNINNPIPKPLQSSRDESCTTIYNPSQELNRNDIKIGQKSIHSQPLNCSQDTYHGHIMSSSSSNNQLPSLNSINECGELGTLKNITLDQPCNISSSIHDSDISWDVESIQPILDIQNYTPCMEVVPPMSEVQIMPHTPFDTNNYNGQEIWDNEIFHGIYPQYSM